MKIAVLGGGGAMGRAVSRELAEHDGIRVSIFDADTEAISSIARAIPSEVDSDVLDVTDHDALVGAMERQDVVANALPYAFNLYVMDACLAAETQYLDLGGLYHTTREQLRLDDEFDAANLTAVLGMGASPGLTNVAVAKGASELDRVRQIHIRTGTRGGEGFAYSAKTILNELTERPICYENGELIETEPLSGRETYTLPEPVGEVEGVYSIHSELATLPFTFPGVETVDFRVAFSPELLSICDALVTLGLTSEEEIEFEGVTTTPRTFLDWYLGQQPTPEAVEEWKSFQVDVVGEVDGENAYRRYTTVVRSRLDEWNLGATAVWTGVPLGVAAELVARGDVLTTGAVPPEVAFDPNTILDALTEREIVIEETHVS
ncbi:saccharopine dehydrogenase C-terminal domain-containing protein [Haladaptatus sp. CMAA 1911]|uniref:saccharopine dehydrogenase family protein n=1 Tax=unclassified Haladaptatus TaxID=2622732 RepID=UPI003754EF80